MILISKLKPETQNQLIRILGPLAWSAFIISIILGRLKNPRFDFIAGLLMGISMVGNLVYLYATARKLHK